MLKLKLNREKLALGLILALSGFLYFFAAWKEGYANTYYSAAIKSMLQNFKNFFFVSFDPGGYVSVDKPALGLWIQALFAWLFGFKGWTMILPEALASVISVATLYRLVKKPFGSMAGLVAALALAVTPIFTAVSRTNNLDATLILLLLLAAAALLKSIEQSGWKWLVLSFVLVGLGFNVKMLQAFLVLPAFYLVYMLFASVKPLKRLGRLAAATAILLAVSLSWAVIVDLTPASERPYIGSSQTNSVLELALGYNGIQRVLPWASAMGMNKTAKAPDGNVSAPAASTQSRPDLSQSQVRQSQTGISSRSDTAAKANQPFTPAQAGKKGAPSRGGLGGNGGEGGEQGILRIFNQQMAGQIGWLIPIAFFGLAFTGFRQWKRRKSWDKLQSGSLVLWGIWMITMIAYFSIAGFFHRYYMATLAPGIAALTGIGIAAAYSAHKEDARRRWPLPSFLLGSFLVQAVILARYPDWNKWLLPLMAITTVAAVAGLTINFKGALKRWLGAKTALTAGIVSLLLAPAAWSVTPIIYGGQNVLPLAGPELAGNGFGSGGPREGSSNAALTAYLQAHQGGAKYLVAVPNATSAASFILDTGKATMAVGGFLGSDPILTVDKLAALVKKGEIRYFLISDGPGFGKTAPNVSLKNESGTQNNRPENSKISGGEPNRSQSAITAWVKTHGKLVSQADWISRSDTAAASKRIKNAPGRFGEGMYQLYDLS